MKLDVLESPIRKPIRRVLDLDIGESKIIELSSGQKVNVTLLEVDEICDEIRLAVRTAKVKALIDGEEIVLSSANYHLPVRTGKVTIDCPVTGGYMRNATKNDKRDRWALYKDARLRIWPGDSPLIEPGTFVYPAQQRWFASATQMCNEPTYVDAGDNPMIRRIYYHDGLDIGGAEGMVDVVAASRAFVLSVGLKAVPGYEVTPAVPGHGRVYTIDEQGWMISYVHLKEIHPSVRPGTTVEMGQPIGILGKEGESGGWAHLHFNIKSMQPSGEWGTEEAYAYLWESYMKEYSPPLVAVARPHVFGVSGKIICLDGTRSKSFSGDILSFEWLFGDGSRASGPVVTHEYGQSGVYSEILKITDSKGNVDYDFFSVNIVNPNRPYQLPLGIHAAYAPTFGIKPGDPVTIKVRSFNTTAGSETIDLGDGSPFIEVKSDGNINVHSPRGYAEVVHRYQKSGQYIVRLERPGPTGARAVSHLQVRVGMD